MSTESFYWPLSDEGRSLHSKTLILPVVCVANLGQLAADLLISSLGLQRVGIFDSSALIPIVGALDTSGKGIVAPLELYGKDGLDFVVVQQRSPALKARKDKFIELLLTFVSEYQMSGLLLLSGVDMTHRSDYQMHTPIYQIVPSGYNLSTSKRLAGVNQLPIYEFPGSTSIAGEAPSQKTIPLVPGGGLTRRILSSDLLPSSIAVACILQFVLEGDNRGDAALMASAVNQLLGLEISPSQWKQPESWNQGLFGAPHDQSIFG